MVEFGSANLDSNLDNGSAKVDEAADVDGPTDVDGSPKVNRSADVDGAAEVHGAAEVGGTGEVDKLAEVHGAIGVDVPPAGVAVYVLRGAD